MNTICQLVKTVPYRLKRNEGNSSSLCLHIQTEEHWFSSYFPFGPIFARCLTAVWFLIFQLDDCVAHIDAIFKRMRYSSSAELTSASHFLLPNFQRRLLEADVPVNVCNAEVELSRYIFYWPFQSPSVASQLFETKTNLLFNMFILAGNTQAIKFFHQWKAKRCFCDLKLPYSI